MNGLKRSNMDLTYEERIALLEERAIALSMSQSPRLLELNDLKNDVRRCRQDLRRVTDEKETQDLGSRLDGVICEAIATLQGWIENAPARAAA